MVGGAFQESAVFGDTAANAGAESEIDTTTVEAASLKKCSEIGIVLEMDWAVEQVFYRGDEVKIVPWTITKGK